MQQLGSFASRVPYRELQHSSGLQETSSGASVQQASWEAAGICGAQTAAA